jgi:hypothetical protein
MDSRKKSPRSRFSADTSPGFRASTIETWSESKPAFSPLLAARMARKSSTYSIASESQSIMIFTDVEELLTPRTEDINAWELPDNISVSRSRRMDPESKSLPVNSGPKLSRLDSLTPKPLRLVFQPQKKRYNDNSQAFDFLEGPNQVTTRKFGKGAARDTPRKPENFPRPPRRSFYHPKRILRFTGLFPEPRRLAGGQRSLANFDKILPQPPYHVFDLKRKEWLLVLLILITFLSPLSVIIYFPAIRSVATV